MFTEEWIYEDDALFTPIASRLTGPPRRSPTMPVRAGTLLAADRPWRTEPPVPSSEVGRSQDQRTDRFVTVVAGC
jgi:hypothetical protein